MLHVPFPSTRIMSKQILSPSKKTFSKWSESIIGFELSLNGEIFHWIFMRPLICALAKIFWSLFVTVLFLNSRKNCIKDRLFCFKEIYFHLFNSILDLSYSIDDIDLTKGISRMDFWEGFFFSKFELIYFFFDKKGGLTPHPLDMREELTKKFMCVAKCMARSWANACYGV